jgi:hypothetical protein
MGCESDIKFSTVARPWSKALVFPFVFSFSENQSKKSKCSFLCAALDRRRAFRFPNFSTPARVSRPTMEEKSKRTILDNAQSGIFWLWNIYHRCHYRVCVCV